MTRRRAIAMLSAVTTFTASSCMYGQSKSKGDKKMKQFAPHPGTIRMIDESDNSVHLVKAEDAPDSRRFVLLDKKGIEVQDAEQAVERIPIVEVRMTPTDGKGNLVSKDKAQLIRIKEYGPEGRLLRSTTMVPN
jgi:hypothetical protein